MATALREVGTAADAERQVRIDLAAVHRLAHRFGWDDNIFNHLTHTVPGRTDRFLVKPHGLLMSEVTASNLITVDQDGSVVQGEGTVERSALHIHAAMHIGAPQAACILHVHPPYATWLTCLQDNRLKMTNQNTMRFYDRIAYDDHYGGLATARAEGERMTKALGNYSVMMHANHGVTTAGPTVAAAFYDLYYLEKICQEYFLVVSSGAAPRVIDDKTAAQVAKDLMDEYEEGASLTWAAWKRVLDREEPEYKD